MCTVQYTFDVYKKQSVEIHPYPEIYSTKVLTGEKFPDKARYVWSTRIMKNSSVLIRYEFIHSYGEWIEMEENQSTGDEDWIQYWFLHQSSDSYIPPPSLVLN